MLKEDFIYINIFSLVVKIMMHVNTCNIYIFFWIYCPNEDFLDVITQIMNLLSLAVTLLTCI
jgi:hypothetical protein